MEPPGGQDTPPLAAAQEVYRCARHFLLVTGGRDTLRFDQLCRWELDSDVG